MLVLGVGSAWADEVRLETIELLTGGAQADEALPIIVAVHGLGGTPQHFAEVFAELPERARVVLPRAPDPQVVGWSWFPIPRLGVGEGGLEDGLARSRDRLAALLERLPRERRGVGRPVLTGFSQGGMLSFAVAVARPDLVVRVVPIAGWLPVALQPHGLPGGPRVPIRALHGADDRLLLVGATRLLVSRLLRTGFDVSLREYAGVGHTITPAVRRDLFSELAKGIAAARAEAAVAP